MPIVAAAATGETSPGSTRTIPARSRQRRFPTLATMSSWVAATGMAVASVMGLAVEGVYGAGIAVDAALRGGDVVNLVIAVPALVVAVVWSASGSRRGEALWLGLLAYTVYAYGYYVFTPTFNDLFLIHVVVLVAAAAGLITRLATADAPTFGPPGVWRARVVAVFLLLIAVALVWTWGSASVRFALTAQPPTDVLPYPEWRVHLGYVMDLVFVVPAAAVVGVLLWRRTARSWLLSTAVTTWLLVYQLNYLATTMLLANAGVPA